MAPIGVDWTPTPAPTPEPDPVTPEEAARIAWPWLHANCAPSAWARFTRSVAVRQPQVRDWPTT